MPTTLITASIHVADIPFLITTASSTYVLMPGVAVVSDGASLFYDNTAPAGVQLLLAGIMTTQAGEAIHLTGSYDVVSLAETAFVASTWSGSFLPVVGLLGDSSNFTNAGAILSGIGIGVLLTGDGSTGSNTGRIEAGLRAVELGVRASFVNDGFISAVYRTTFSHAGGIVVEGITTNVVNTGTISAGGGINTSGVAFFADGGNLTNSGTISCTTSWGVLGDALTGFTLVNTGLIQGNLAFGSVLGGALADSVTNHGTLTGDVDLGAGSDLFDGRGGTVLGVVKGGDGGDSYFLSDADLQIVELDSDTGTDTLFASVDFALESAQYIEVLSLIGPARIGTGNAGANIINGNHLANSLSGLGGNDTLRGDSGNDTLLGGAGNDLLNSGDDGDRLDGGSGNDTANAGDGDDQLLGRAGNDSLVGEADDDTLLGGVGNDLLSGGAGDDVLIGGAGKDYLSGGADADVFRFDRLGETALGSGRDQVAGFLTKTDQIDLSRMDANAATGANDAFVFIAKAAFTGVAGQLRYAVSGANIIIFGDINADSVADFEIQVNGVASIAALDFLL